MYYTASGIITPIGGRPVHRLREDLYVLHMLLSVSVESDVIRQAFVFLTALSASGHLASDACTFVSLLCPMLRERKILSPGPEPTVCGLAYKEPDDY